MSEIDTTNKFLVGAKGDGIRMIVPPQPYQLITREDALVLAAYIVAMADPDGDEFTRVLEAVYNA